MDKYKTDIIVLAETGKIEMDLVRQSFLNFKFFYQKGENSWGGVLLLVKKGISATRVKCEIPNVVSVDIKFERTVRISGVYAPTSKTWKWNDLTSLITENYVMLGDFNIDLHQRSDVRAAEDLMNWMDSVRIGPVLPDENTSLRSNRTIDYALSKGVTCRQW